MTWRIALVLILILLLAGCATTPDSDVNTSTFLLVRHAEKATGDQKDPSLTPAGEARARHLAEVLADTTLSAIYSTDYERTRGTAHPISQAQSVAVQVYDASQPAAAFAATLRERHRNGNVLVVGHSNTIPGIASQLCDCAVEELDETEYGDLFIIRMNGQGRPTLQRDRF